MSEQQTISAEKLCALTGLTDRRHRQIAKEGFFPPPIKGQYQLAQTLQGLFRYYREMGEYKKNRKEKIDEEKHRKLKLENDETEGRLTDTNKLAEMVAPSLAEVRDLLYQKITVELPVSLSGVDVATGRMIATRIAGELLAKWQGVFKRWAL